MAYTPIQTENTLDKVYLSETTKQVFDKINANSAEEDTRADRADAKFEAIEDTLADLPSTYEAKFTDGSAGIASVSNDIVTLKSGVTQSGGTISNDSGSDITLAKVAKTGAYSDLSGQPSIPTKDSDLTNDRYVRYDTGSQGLKDTQKSNARTNIGAGTVTSVGAGTGLSISGTATVNPTVNVASDRKLPTTTEWSTVNSNISAAQTSANNAQTSADNAQARADDAYALAEGRENATSYTNYQAMVAALNAESTATLKVGDNIYIETVGVPDLWVSGVLDSKASYTYTSDQAIVDALNNPSIGYVNIGWYRLDELETAKVDLSGYVQKTTTVTGAGALGGGGALSQNRTITHNAGSAPNKAYGLYKISTDAYSHVSVAEPVETEDLTALLDDSYLAKNNPTGTGSLSLNRKADTTIGNKSVAIGNNCTASGSSSFAEGASTSAQGSISHAEGHFSIASGEAAHAEGHITVASGNYSHAEGNTTYSVGQSQHVFGEYNILDSPSTPPNERSKNVEIVGNGTSSSARSNARTLDWNGNEWIAGNMKVNKTTLANTASSDVTVNLPSSSGTLALTSDIPAPVDPAILSDFTETNGTTTHGESYAWSGSADNWTLTITFTDGKEHHPFVCYNSNNTQVMVELSFTAVSGGSSTVVMKTDNKFSGKIYSI